MYAVKKSSYWISILVRKQQRTMRGVRDEIWPTTDKNNTSVQELKPTTVVNPGLKKKK